MNRSPHTNTHAMSQAVQALLGVITAKPPEQRLQEFADREDIKELTARYAHRRVMGVSMADLYTDDGVFTCHRPGKPVLEVRGRKALDKMYGGLTKNTDQALGMIYNHLIRIEGDQAFGLCSLELRIIEDGQSIIGSGYYEDQFRRQNGVWKFVARMLTFIHWVPIQQGWTGAAS